MVTAGKHLEILWSRVYKSRLPRVVDFEYLCSVPFLGNLFLCLATLTVEKLSF